MAQNEVDPIDLAAIVIVPIAGAMVFGVWTLNIDVFGGYNFSDPLFTTGGVDFTVALLLTVAGVAWIIGTNQLDGSDYETEEYALIGGSLLLPIAYEFMPAFESLIHTHDVIRLAAVFALAGAAAYISYVD